MNPSELQRLIQRYRSGAATPEEKQQLEQLWQENLSDPAALGSHGPATFDWTLI